MESILEATIAIRDIHYPFEEYKVALGIPYLRTANNEKAIRNKKVVLKNRATLYDDELEVVAIVGKNFALVPNELVEDMVEKAVNAYDLQILAKKRDRYENSIRIDLLSPKIGEVEVGDIIQFGVSIRNSIDGSSSLAVDAFSYRLKCKNGATARIEDTTFAVKHIGNPEELVKAFNKALGEALERADRLLTLYHSMNRARLTKEGLYRLIDLRFPRKYYRLLPINIEKESIELVEEVSLWQAFNSITYMITHESRASPLARSYMTHRLHSVMQELVRV